VTIDPAEARRTASVLVQALTVADEQPLRFDGMDLLPALEQQLFFALRDGRTPAAGARGVVRRGIEAARPLGAAALGLAAWRLPQPGDGPIAVLVRDATHYPVLMQIEAELQRNGGEALALLRVGRAAGPRMEHSMAPRLADLVDSRLALAAFGQRGALARALAGSDEAWSAAVGPARAGELRQIASLEGGRIALGAAALVSAARRWRPSLLAAFDEIGTWARILPTVARRHGIPSLDLPHAEAADAEAIRGAGYDVMATYGPAASRVLRAAGVVAERIVEIGAPRFDQLVALVESSGQERTAAPARPRVVFAAQYETGAMHRPVLEACYGAALAAAEAVGAELVVVPHPAEQPGIAASLVHGGRAGDRVAVRLAEAGDLHRELIGSWLLVTGWSNAVFEAAIAGVPALTVNPGGVAPVNFAAEGLALGATDATSAANLAAGLREQETRHRAVRRAREVAAERLGALDGRASWRAARLMLAMARGEPWRSAA
jgi:hypothetical protein